MKISSALNRGLMFAAMLSVPTLGGWMALRHQTAVKHAVAPPTAPQVAKDDAAEAQRKKDATSQWLAESRRKLQETNRTLEELRQRRQDLQAQLARQKSKSGVRPISITAENSIEFSPVDRERSTWTGHTDPDRVWHDQREKARQTLIQFNLSPSASQR